MCTTYFENVRKHEVMDMLISLIAVHVSQCMHISNQVIHFQCVQFVIVNYTSIKQGKNVGFMNVETVRL